MCKVQNKKDKNEVKKGEKIKKIKSLLAAIVKALEKGKETKYIPASRQYSRQLLKTYLWDFIHVTLFSWCQRKKIINYEEVGNLDVER